MAALYTSADRAAFHQRLQSITSQPDPLQLHKDAAPFRAALYPTTEPEAIGNSLVAQMKRDQAAALAAKSARERATPPSVARLDEEACGANDYFNSPAY